MLGVDTPRGMTVSLQSIKAFLYRLALSSVPQHSDSHNWASREGIPWKGKSSLAGREARVGAGVDNSGEQGWGL